MTSFFFYTTFILFLIICVFLILLILIQKGRGGGLASAFGGAGGNTAFGSKTGDVLTWATSIVFGIFLLLAVALNLLANQVGNAPPKNSAAVTSTTPPPGAPPAESSGPITANPIQEAKSAAHSTTAP
jgi:preprotein translocase subunit SecG